MYSVLNKRSIRPHSEQPQPNPRGAKKWPICERFDGKPAKHPHKSLCLDPADAGPSAPEVSYERWRFD